MGKVGTVSMLDLRKRTAEMVKRIERGQRLILTYRGRPIGCLAPIASPVPWEDDPFYRLGELGAASDATLSNRAIDDHVYGP
jgi:prevent-host-death family protein